MDTKKLVVGQKVWMQSGDQFKEATVEEITENYVRVFIAPTGPFYEVVAKRWAMRKVSHPIIFLGLKRDGRKGFRRSSRN
jgi:hypothetical protein